MASEREELDQLRKWKRLQELEAKAGGGSGFRPPMGPVVQGNIDLHSRPVVKNGNDYSTVRSMSFGTDEGEVLIPTVSDAGRIMSDRDAMANYERTGKHLGIFGTPSAATAYAEKLHNDQAAEYGARASGNQPPNSLYDAAASVPGGLAMGASAIPGMLGDIASLATPSNEAPPETMLSRVERAIRPGNVLPGSKAIYDALGSPFGGFHEPKTTAGEYARTISSFAPAALAPGSAAMRAARVAVPGATSETAGQLTKGSPYETPARIAGALLGGGITEAAPPVYDYGKRVVNKAVASTGGREFINPSDAAARYLSPAFKSQNPNDLAGRIDAWKATGADDPAWLDVGGGEFQRRVRAAAAEPKGATPDLVRDYQRNVAGNIQDRASRLAGGLTPGTNQSAAQYTDELTQLRDTLAKEKYAPAYESMVTPNKELVTGLMDAPGRQAIASAIEDAKWNLDGKTVAELRNLQNVIGRVEKGTRLRDEAGKIQSLTQAVGDLSGRALDRVRIAMRDAGISMAKNDQKYRAKGAFTRTNLIDTALDEAPGLIPARAEYRNMSQQIEAVPLGQEGTRRNIAPDVSGMSGMQKTAAGVGYRDALTNSIRHPAAGATGVLNRVGTSTEQGENLAALYGEGAANKFRKGITNEIDRLQNARFINPNMGSQTMPRALDAMVLESVPTTKAAILAKALSVLKSGSTLTPAQSAEVVRMGISPAKMQAIIAAYPQMPPQQAALNLLLRVNSARVGGETKQ